MTEAVFDGHGHVIGNGNGYGDGYGDGYGKGGGYGDGKQGVWWLWR